MTANGRSDFHAQAPADFDADWYLATYPDVALTGLEPRAHFLKFGRMMGRAPNARVQAMQAAAAPAEPGAPAALPETQAARFGAGAPADWPAPALAALTGGPIVAAPDDLRLRPRPGTLERQVDAGALCLMAGAVEIGRFAGGTDLAPALAPIAAYARLTGLGTANDGVFALHRRQGLSGETETLSALLDRARPGCGGARLRTGAGRIENAWFADEGRLRVYLAGGDRTADAAGLVLRAYQAGAADPAALRLVGGLALPPEGPGFLDVALHDPLMPVLLELTDRAGMTLEFGLLAFPSLCRGGLHAAERAALQLGHDPMDEIWRLCEALLREALAVDSPPALARIEVDLDGATGAERIFSPDVRRWLATVFGIAVAPAPGHDAADPAAAYLAETLATDAPAPGDPARRAKAALTLRLPAAAVPTLGALVTRGLRLPDGLDTAAGPYLVAEATSFRPLWSVALPMTGPAPGRDQPLLTRSGPAAATPADAPARHWLAPLHLAVLAAPTLPVHDILTLMPRDPDAPLPATAAATATGTPDRGDLSVVLTATDPALTRRFLDALAQQRGCRAGDLRLRLAVPPDSTAAAGILAAAEAAFPGRCQVIDAAGPAAPDLDRIAAGTAGAWTLIAEDSVILYDPRTLARLEQILDADPTAGAVGCALLHEAVFKKSTRIQVASAGLFPGQVSLAAAPRLGLHEPDCLAALPHATYPVIANGFALCLVRSAAIRATEAARADLPGGAAADLKFGLDAFAAGWRSLCTTTVRAGTTRAPTRRDEIDPLGLACVLPARWDDLLSQVTVLRQLRG